MGLMDDLVEKYGKELNKKLADPTFFIDELLFKPKGWIMPPYGKEWLKLAYKHKRINFTAFRSSGKTEIMLIAQAIHRAFTQKNWDGIIISNSLKQSTEVLRRVRDGILDSEILRNSLSSSKYHEQNKTTLTLKNGSRIRSLPYNDNIRMNHVDWVGMDEIGLYRDHDLMKSAITPIVTAKEGSIHCIGTPMSKIDLIHKLRDNKSYLSKIYPAYTEKMDLFKQRYSDREIRKVGGKFQILLADKSIFEEYDSLTWNREFLCVPLGNEDNLFPYELIEQSFQYDLTMNNTLNTNSRYYMGIDFALSAESSADFTVIIILERTKEGQLILCDMIRWKGMSYNAQKVRISEVIRYYKPVKAILDESSFGASFLDDVRREVRGVSIEGMRFTAGAYTNVKQDIITMLRSTFESNWRVYSNNEKTPLENEKKNFVIPRERTDGKTMKLTTEILEELLSFGIKYDEVKHTVKFEGIGSHDDIVVALGLANFAANGSGNLSPMVSRGSSGYRKMFVKKTR